MSQTVLVGHWPCNVTHHKLELGFQEYLNELDSEVV